MAPAEPPRLSRRDLLPGLLLALLLATAAQLPPALACFANQPLQECATDGPQHWLRSLGFLAGSMLALAGLQALLWRRAWPRRVKLVLQVLGLTAVNAVLMLLLTPDMHGLGAYALQYVLTYALCLVLGLDFLLRGRADSRLAARMQREQPQLERELDEARTQLLQAQVEPHFLFNTLAHLRRLAQTDPASSRAMLADLLRYLQEALPSLRSDTTLLGNELALVGAYLALHQRRMGEARLHWRIDAEAGLAAIPLPSTALLTLVENAIKHGIAPQVEGGEVVVSARREGPGQLLLQVADTGRGMGATSGHGTGLANLRARLAAQHGEAASLSLHLNQPRGLIVSLRLPA